MESNIKCRKLITTNFELKLERADIIAAARQELKAAGNEIQIPDNAEVEFVVPGGGVDWSNRGIDIDKDNPVLIRWTTEEGGYEYF